MRQNSILETGTHQSPWNSGDDSLNSSQANEPGTPHISLDLVNEVTVPGDVRNLKNMMLGSGMH